MSRWNARFVGDWSQYLDRAEKRIVSFGWTNASIRGGESYREFSGTDSLGEALELARRGWRDGTERLERDLIALESVDRAERDDQSRWSMDVVGAFPCVGSYLAGDPEYMHSQENLPYEAPVIRLYAGANANVSCTVGQVNNYGAALLCLIDALEENGQSVELVWYAACYGAKPGRKRKDGTRKWHCVDNQFFGIEVTLKRAGEHLDLDRLAFALGHPSMSRRLACAIREIDLDYMSIEEIHGFPVATYPAFAREPGTVYLPGLPNFEEGTRDDPKLLLAALRRRLAP